MLINIDPTDVPGLHLPSGASTVLLRVFALQSFTSDDGLRIIQPGVPNDGPFYKEVICNVSGTTVSIPSLQLESQTDAFNPGEHGARYYAAFYLPDGGFIAPFQPLSNFQIRHDYQPTSWPKIVAYNTAPYVPARAWQTYTQGQVDALFQLLTPTVGDGAVFSVFGREGDVTAMADDYDIPKITGLQAALDGKASISHTHDASAIVSGVFPPVRLGSGPTGDVSKFLRSDGTWATPPTGSSSGGVVTSVFGRPGDVIALSGDYDIPKISGLQSALDGKAGLPHFHDGSALTTGIVAAARLGSGLSGSGSSQFLRGDGVWTTPTTVSVDAAANYTWTGTHLFKGIAGTFTVQGPAGKELIGASGDDGVSTVTWASLSLVKGTGAALIYDVDGTFNNRRSVRLDAAAIHLRGAVLALEVSTDGTTFTQYAGTSFTGGNTAFNILATAAGSQSAGYTIGGLPAAVQVYASALFNTQSLTGDIVTQFPGKRYGFAFNAADRYSMLIDSDAGDGGNTALWLRQTGQLRRVVADSSKVLSFGLGGDPTVAGVFLRGDGVWATPAGSGPGGAVSSVGLAVDLTMFANPGPAVTSSGTLSVAFAVQSAQKFLAGPVSGTSAVPTFRLLASTDIPAIDAGSITTGIINPARLAPGVDPTKFLRGDSTWQTPPGGTGSGTVISVALGAPSSLFTVSGSPVTISGTLTLALANQSFPNIFAAPTSGGPGPPVFRPMVQGDIPVLTTAVIGSGVFPPARLGASPTSTTFLRGDGVFATPTVGAVSGPGLTIAAFDGFGLLITSGAAAPIEYDGSNVHFKTLGLQLDSGFAYTQKFSGGNVCPIVYAQDGGSADPTGKGLLLFGPPNASDGLTGSSATGLRVLVRCGTGSPGDGSGRGDLLIDGRLTGSDLVAPGSVAGNPSGVAGMVFKGWMGLNYWSSSTSKPFVPTAPLTVGRNDNGSDLLHLHQRGSIAGVPLRIQGFGFTSTGASRNMFSIVNSFTTANDATRASRMEFWLSKNGVDAIPQFYIAPATGPSSTGLFVQLYTSTGSSTLNEIQLTAGGELGSYPDKRVLVLSV